MPNYVSNTGPFISLEKLDGDYQLLRQLGVQIIIPPQILEELTNGMPADTDYLNHFGITDLVTVQISPEPNHILKKLDYGERYAIALAATQRLPLLIEDQKARVIAEQMGIKVFGIAGLIVLAQRNGSIPFSTAQQHLMQLHIGERISEMLLHKLIAALRQ
jgi:hypothetical protein